MFDKSAFPSFVHRSGTFQPELRETVLGKVTEEGGLDAFDVLEGVVEVRGNCTGREGVDHRELRWLQSTYRPGSSSLSDSAVCEGIVLCRGWRQSCCDYVL